jgi:hypothetical protein
LIALTMENNTNYEAIYYAIFSNLLLFPASWVRILSSAHCSLTPQYVFFPLCDRPSFTSIQSKRYPNLYFNFKPNINHFNNKNPPADKLNLSTPAKFRFLKIPLNVALTHIPRIACPCSRKNN